MEAIIVENLVKKYGDFEAVRGISFKVRRGEIFAFLDQMELEKRRQFIC